VWVREEKRGTLGRGEKGIAGRGAGREDAFWGEKEVGSWDAGFGRAAEERGGWRKLRRKGGTRRRIGGFEEGRVQMWRRAREGGI
jgi:hypothetical protein